MRPEIRFTVYGEPKTKGSLRAFVVKGKGDKKARAVVTEGKSAPQRDWYALVTHAATEAMGDRPLFEGPLEFFARWTLPKPRTSRNRYPALKNRDDGDKHQRAVWDSLTNTVWVDDGLVVDWHGSKRYVGQIGALPRPGVEVLVREMP